MLHHPNNHMCLFRFRAHWDVIVKRTTDQVDKLQKALKEIQDLLMLEREIKNHRILIRRLTNKLKTKEGNLKTKKKSWKQK